VQVSTNGGSTWNNLGFMADPAGTNWYNTNQGGGHYFSGSVSGWTTSTYSLVAFNNVVAPVQFRFRFFSDPSGQSDGWAIDDFAILVPVPAIDAALRFIMSPDQPVQMASSVPITLRVKNTGAATIMGMQLIYKINNGNPVSEVYAGNLLSGGVLDFTFSTPLLAPLNDYLITASIAVAGDMNSSNDSLSLPVLVTPASIDAGVVGMVSPPDTILASVTLPVTVTLRNFGTNPITQADLQFKVNQIAMATEQWTGNLLPGDTLSYTFSYAYMPATSALLSFCAEVLVTGDPNSVNDQFCKMSHSFIGIGKQDSGKLLLMQNRPNPASDHTLIDFSTKVAGEVQIEVLNSEMKLMTQWTQTVPAGNHTVRINTQPFPAGVYQYSLHFSGEKVTRRMIVVH
jgi:hypothetical protein